MTPALTIAAVAVVWAIVALGLGIAFGRIIARQTRP